MEREPQCGGKVRDRQRAEAGGPGLETRLPGKEGRAEAVSEPQSQGFCLADRWLSLPSPRRVEGEKKPTLERLKIFL